MLHVRCCTFVLLLFSFRFESQIRALTPSSVSSEQDPASPRVTFGVHFLLCSWGAPFAQKKRNSIASRGVPRLFRKMTLVFPCFAVYATYEQVSFSHVCRGRFPRNSPVLAKYPHFENDTLKMTLGRARQEQAYTDSHPHPLVEDTPVEHLLAAGGKFG